MPCNLGVGAVAALLWKYYVMMKRAGVLCVLANVVFWSISFSSSNCIFEMPEKFLFIY